MDEAGAGRAPLLQVHSLQAIDWLGRSAHVHLGGWKCSCCVLGVIGLLCLAIFGIVFNLVLFLIQEGETNAAAATTVATISGTQLFCSFLGALLSDAYLGRLWTALIFQLLSTLSFILVGIFVILVSTTGSSKSFLLISLYIMIIVTGPVLPNILGLGVDQLNSHEEKEKYFRLVAIATSIGQLLAATVVTYIDDAGMWVWGFWLCVTASLASSTLVAGGLRWFRHYGASGNPFLRNSQVLVAALRKHRLTLPEDSARLHESEGEMSDIPGCRKLPHTGTLSFLDKAAVLDVTDTCSQWHLCTVTQVEELKSFLRVIPCGVSIAFMTIAVTQISTLFEEQAVLMNRHLGAWFVVPPASLNVLAIVSGILTGLVTTMGRARASSLQLLGLSLLCCMSAMVIAALVESHRLNAAQKGTIISIAWLAPPTILLGIAANLTTASSIDFLYSEVSDSMRSVGGCIALIFCGAGNYLNSLLVTLITVITTHGGRSGWIANNLDEGHADYFYWLLASSVASALCFHIAYAHGYMYMGQRN